ncbi:acyltransferase family protein [Bradyrhizobium guangdongense]
MADTHANIAYRPEIDGLRALAVFSVIFFHAHLKFYGFEPFVGGYLGVDIFFVISGYLIGGIIFDGLGSHSFSLARFYERRARRILPALLLVIMASITIGLLVMTPEPLTDFGRSIIAVIFFVANDYFYFREDYFAESSDTTPLLHTWSLSVEEQFYLLFPLIAMAIWKRAPRFLTPLLIFAIAISFCSAIYNNRSDPSAAFYFFHNRAWELLTGCLLARLERRDNAIYIESAATLLPAVGIALVAIAVCLVKVHETSVSWNTALAVCGSALIIRFGRGCDPVSRFLATRPMVGMGLISYSLYLWHQPVFSFARFYLVNAPDTPTMLGLVSSCILLSYLSWRFVELPFRHRETISLSMLVRCLSSASAVLLIFVGFNEFTGGIPRRFPADQLTLLALKPERATAVIDGRNCRRQSIEDACIIGRADSEPTFAVLGDSHAETLTGPLSDAMKDLSLAAFVYTYPGCPFIAGVELSESKTPCAAFEESVFMALRSHHIMNVIINDRSNAYIAGTTFDNGEGGVEPGPLAAIRPVGFKGTDAERATASATALRTTLVRLLEMGVTVYYVLPVPEVGWHVPRTLVKLISQNRLPLTTSLPKYWERNRRVQQIVQGLEGTPRFVPIYPDKVFCSRETGRCYTHSKDAVFYTDTDHLSREGAERLVSVIVSEIKRRLSESPALSKD